MDASGHVVLEEDAFASALERIVERDFFPDLVEMRQRWSWIAGEGGVRTRSPAEADGSQTGVGDWDTPVEAWDGDGRSVEEREKMLHELHREIEGGKVSLEGFLNRYTSEDNHAFRKVVDKVARKRNERLRSAGMDDAARGSTGVTSTCMPPPQASSWDGKRRFLLEDGNGSGSTGADRSQKRKVGTKMVAQNTRFAVGRGDISASETSTSLGGTSALQSPTHEYLSTPVIRPGEGGATPIVTWGSVNDVVPLEEDESSAQEIRFRIPPTPKRDAVARTLGKSTPWLDQRGSKRRGFTSTHPGSPLSPAGKRLASRALGNTPLLHRDTKLRESYAKAPASTPTTPRESAHAHR